MAFAEPTFGPGRSGQEKRLWVMTGVLGFASDRKRFDHEAHDMGSARCHRRPGPGRGRGQGRHPPVPPHAQHVNAKDASGTTRRCDRQGSWPWRPSFCVRRRPSRAPRPFVPRDTGARTLPRMRPDSESLSMTTYTVAEATKNIQPRDPGQRTVPAFSWRAFRTADRACCCSAGPTVLAVMPPTPDREHPTELLFCGHHNRASRSALAAAGAAVFDAQGVQIAA